LLKAEKVSVSYIGDIDILNSVSVKVEQGKVFAVIGPNGAGKSTLLKTMFGILIPRSGKIMLDDTDITYVPPHERLRKGVSYIPQESGIFPTMSVRENLELAAWLFRKDKNLVKEKIDNVLERFQRLKEKLDVRAGKMSGGEQKLLELAKVLINEPRYLLIDEPTVGLSPIVADSIYDELKKMTSNKLGMLIVDQYIDKALQIADYVYYIELGRIKAEGEPDVIRKGEFLFT